MKIRATVVGYGSIGKRHSRIIQEKFGEVSVVSRRNEYKGVSWKTIEEAVKNYEPDYFVIASKTGEHLSDLSILADTGFQGSVLVEKPLFISHSTVPKNRFKFCAVGYNLRFHPIINKLKSYLQEAIVTSIHIYVGQYLPDWRPQSDYRRSYSAKKTQGGGVLRDLSHELDYLLWLAGPWKRLTALGGHLSDLEIDTEDTVSILAELERCPIATIQMNYLDSRLRREVVVITNKGVVTADLVSETIQNGGHTDVFKTLRDDTYISEHQEILSGKLKDSCTFEQGMEVVSLIDAAERAITTGMWISNE